MNAPKYRLLRSLLFITVLLVKTFISVSPVFANVHNQDDIQMEKESKSDKDESEKELSKLKNFLDKDFLYELQHAPLTGFSYVGHQALFTHPIYCPDHLVAVPTPPPDQRFS